MIKTELKDHILHVTLNNSQSRNALGPDVIKDLTALFTALETKPDTHGHPRAVVLRGDGPVFCAGGDLKWMKASLSFTHEQNIQDTQTLSDMYEALFQCSLPVLAHVHGAAMGGGLGLVAVCDFVACEAEARFCFSEVKLGLVPSIIAPYVLRKSPEALVAPYMLTAEVFGAAQAKQLNLVHWIGTGSVCESVIEEKLKLIRQTAPQAVRITKQLIRQLPVKTWAERRALTVATIAERRQSAEGQEGMKAFFEKREPQWPKS